MFKEKYHKITQHVFGSGRFLNACIQRTYSCINEIVDQNKFEISGSDYCAGSISTRQQFGYFIIILYDIRREMLLSVPNHPH